MLGSGLATSGIPLKSFNGAIDAKDSMRKAVTTEAEGLLLTQLGYSCAMYWIQLWTMQRF